MNDQAQRPDGSLDEPLMLDRTCPIDETEAMIARRLKLYLIAIDDDSYTCRGQIDPHMPAITWTRHDVAPHALQALRAWADAKLEGIERAAEAKVRAIASRVVVRPVQFAQGTRPVAVQIVDGGRHVVDAGYEASLGLDVAERLRRFLVSIALPDLDKRHVDRVLHDLRREDERTTGATNDR